MREWIGPALASPDLVLDAQPPAQPHSGVTVDVEIPTAQFASAKRRPARDAARKVKTKYYRAESCFEQIYFRPVPYAVGVRANLKRSMMTTAQLRDAAERCRRLAHGVGDPLTTELLAVLAEIYADADEQDAKKRESEAGAH
jgi:hypothetical protein